MSQVNGIGEQPAILVEGLTKSFGEVQALRGIDLSVPRGTLMSSPSSARMPCFSPRTA